MSILRHPKRWYAYGFMLVVLLAWTAVHTFAASKNGFNLDNASIPVAEILPGGPPRDGIPALDKPEFLEADAATFLQNEDRVLGIFRNGIAKAYPIGILNWHEIVNDSFAGEGIVVTFCPLCGTGMAFEARIDGRTRSFGVSGLLYNSDVLLYDRESESLWSQIARRAVSGEMLGTSLTMVAVAHTSWADWRSRYPQTLVLSTRTGYSRDYTRNPYDGYEVSEATYFPVANKNNRYHPKELVLGLEIDGVFKAYPFVELAKTGGSFRDQVGGSPVQVEFDAAHRTGRVLNADGVEIPTVIAFWFAWTAFHPETEIYAN